MEIRECTPYINQETVGDKFFRFAEFYNPRNKNNVIDLLKRTDNWGNRKDLKIQALMNQGLNGDLTELQPDGSASLEEQYRWIEWKSYFGTPQNQARLEFLQIVEPMFEEIGVNTEDPLKEPTEEAMD